MQTFVDIGDQVPRRGNWLSVMLGQWLLKLLGWRVVGHIPNVPKIMAIGAPHTSNMDGLVGVAAILAMRLRISIMVKDNLFRWPLTSLWRFLGVIPVHRDSPHGLVGQSVDAYQSHEQLFLGIAPEGTRKSAASWKSGFYRIAEQAQVPIIVAVLDYRRKEIRLPLWFVPTGDYEADMARILACYKKVGAAHPEKMSLPLRQLQETD